MKPSVGVMKVMPSAADSRPVTIEFDAGDQNPAEIYEAFERMLAAWPDARVPLKVAAAKLPPAAGHQPGDRPPRY